MSPARDFAAALLLVLLLTGCACQPTPVYHCLLTTCGETK